MGNEDKGKNSNLKLLENKVKKKSKGSKQISGRTKKSLIKKVPNTEILLPKSKGSWILCCHCTNVTNISEA